MVSIKKTNEAFDILSKYNGKNPYILQLKKKVYLDRDNKCIGDFQIEYILTNYTKTPQAINKIVKIADWYGEKKKKDWETEFIPEKIKIISYLGETKDYYHCYVQYRQSVEPSQCFLSKKGVLTNFFVDDYHNVNVDFDRYDKLSTQIDPNRRIKSQQKDGIKFLLSRKQCILADDMGYGKMEPIDSIIPTEKGFKTMENIEVGDKIYNQYGKLTTVLKTYYHKNKDIYKITFSDKTECECGLEHLWVVRDSNMRIRKRGWKTMSLQEIINSGIHYCNGHNKYEIPVCEPVDYEEKKFLISPYTLGIMIGDENNGKYKFIPEEYKIGSISQRMELLRGLMDSDGTITKTNNKISYTTVSKQLAYDVKEIVYSLGGTARIHCYDRSKEGKNIEYHVSIQIKENPFHLERKRKRYNPTFKKYCTKYIEKVEYSRKSDAKCLAVDSECHTYLTGRNYIVTHNTLESTVAAIEGNFDSILIICPASLKLNWKKELMYYVPEKDISIIDGFLTKTKPELEKFLGYKEGKSGLKREELLEEAKKKGKWESNRFVIINYEILNEFYQIPKGWSVAKITEALNNSPLLQYIQNRKSLVIIDEAHRLSNSKSDQYKLIKDLLKRGNPESLYLLTGTPITNNPANLFCVLQLLNDPITNDWDYYMERYCGAMKIPRKGEKQKWTDIFLRNHKKDNWYALTNEEKDELKIFIREHAKMITIAKDGTNLEELKERISHIYLRRVKEDLNQLPNKTVHKVIRELTYPQQIEYNRLWDEYEAEQKAEDADKELNKELLEGQIYRKYLSNQMVPYTMKIIDYFIKRGEKIVVACCYDEELYTLKDNYGDRCVIFNGKMNAKQKDAAVKAFMEDPEVMVFIGNIDAAGVGITLTSSCKMVFNNFSYVPGDDRQMEDRIYRIGQQRDVDIYYQFFKDTQYEKIWNTVLSKEFIIDQVIKKETEK